MTENTQEESQNQRARVIYDKSYESCQTNSSLNCNETSGAVILFLVPSKSWLPSAQTPMRHSHLAVIQQHAVHFLDGAVGGVLSLKVDKGVALGSVFIAHHLEQRRTWADFTSSRVRSHVLNNVT